uniref:Pentacotripeptide-repeat region of PRORP domain-containing protein n=1 Tax=Fagus sylvatica TaxID=28930 RepID=A0A2N9IM08_FAGSY
MSLWRMSGSRGISLGAWMVRHLSTGMEVSEKDRKAKQLYRRVAAQYDVAETLNAYIEEGKSVDNIMLHDCAKELNNKCLFEHALQVMEWMELRKIRYTCKDPCITFRSYIYKLNRLSAAEDYFNGLPSIAKDRLTYEILLRCYCMYSMEEKALSLFKTMDELNLVSSELVFYYLMHLYKITNQPEKVPPLVEEMKQRKIPLGALTYNMWMDSYRNLNDIEGFERVLSEDENKPDWTAYSNLAAMYVEAGLFEKAESALKKLEEAMKPMECQAYNILITLYASTNNLGEVHRVWNSLKSVSPPTSNMSYLIMLQALRKLKDIDGLTNCYKDWESSCSSYDVRLANVVISTYLSQDMYEDAALVFESAFKRCKGPFFPAREMFMVYLLKSRQLPFALCHLELAFLEGEQFWSRPQEHLDPLTSLHEYKNWIRVDMSSDPVLLSTGANHFHDKWHPAPETVTAFFDYFEGEKDVEGAERFCMLLKIYKWFTFDIYHLLRKTYIAAGKLTPEMRQRLKELEENYD